MDIESSFYGDDNFPQGYVKYLIEVDSDPEIKYVFASCHKEVREELDRQGVAYIIAAPRQHFKKTYMLNYVRRGNSAAFINKINSNWLDWLKEIDVDYYFSRKKKKQMPYVIWLDKGVYLSDVLGEPESQGEPEATE